MTNPLTDEVIDKAVDAFYDVLRDSEVLSLRDDKQIEKAQMRAAAKVIESALAGDRRDAERYQYIRDSCGQFVHYKDDGTHGLLEDEKLDSAVDLAIEKMHDDIKGKSHE